MDSQITAFYSGANVLITGGTGLLGQLLVEKLFRTCRDIKGIYLILRGKKGRSAPERILEAYEGPVFEKLREVHPEFIKKVHVVGGDCSKLKLGLAESSRQLLIDNVNIVFHCAASLNMDAKLQEAVYTNIRGLSELLDLCHEISNLKSVVFVSTAYSNCIHKVIEEKFYNVPLQPDTVVKLTDEADSYVLDDLTPQLLDRWPNTYCYSKAIAEELIRRNVGILPISLFRPSIIMPTYSEPIPGWTCNVYGPVGIFIVIGLGVVRVTNCNPDVKIDIVPGDLCTNALICTAWETHLNFKVRASPAPIYNYCGGENRNITFRLMEEYASCYEYPLRNAIWAMSHTYIQSKILYKFLEILLHYIPGYLLDLYLISTGQKARMIKGYQKISKIMNVLNVFMCREWAILNDNVYKLWDRMNETDKILFPFNMDAVNYSDLLLKCATGIKVYIMKESLEHALEDKKRYRRLVILHETFKVLLLVAFLVLIYNVYCAVFY